MIGLGSDKNTDHNDLIDSPDSLADEMGKLEGEIAFPPVPVNYYFVLLAIFDTYWFW